MKLIFNYLRRYKFLFFLNIIAVVSITITELGLPFILSIIIDKGIAKNDKTIFYHFIPHLIFLAFLGLIGSLIANYCVTKTSALVLKDMRNDIFIKTQKLSYQDINKVGVASLLTRTTTDIFQILNFIIIFYRAAIASPLVLIASLTLILIKTPQLIISIIIILPLVVIGLLITVKIAKKLSVVQQKQIDGLNKKTRENIKGVKVIRSFRKTKFEENIFLNMNNDYTTTSIKMFRVMNFIYPMFYFLFNISILILMFYGAKLISIKEISQGQFVEFLDYQFNLMFSVLNFSLLFLSFPKTMVCVKRVKEILDIKPSVFNNEKNYKNVDNKGVLEFKNVFFKFDDADEYILNDISFKIYKGETIAFVGSTGSGKSTLINLIPRLYDVTSGEILIDEVNIKDYNLKHLRNKIGFISQKAILFKGSFEYNIKFGNKYATKEDVSNAARIANAEEFILKKPGNYDYLIEESGNNLSGGQKQRISIARAVLKKPPIFIFDDSFSALDFKTDYELRKKLIENNKESIKIIVAQRLNTIVNADKIVVMNKGKIVDIGKHSDLIKNCEIYKEIAISQNMEVGEW